MRGSRKFSVTVTSSTSPYCAALPPKKRSSCAYTTLAADAGDEGQLREDPQALLVDPPVVHIRAERVIAVLEVEHHERHVGGRDLLETLDDLFPLGLVRGRLELRAKRVGLRV